MCKCSNTFSLKLLSYLIFSGGMICMSTQLALLYSAVHDGHSRSLTSSGMSIIFISICAIINSYQEIFLVLRAGRAQLVNFSIRIPLRGFNFLYLGECIFWGWICLRTLYLITFVNLSYLG